EHGAANATGSGHHGVVRSAGEEAPHEGGRPGDNEGSSMQGESDVEGDRTDQKHGLRPSRSSSLCRGVPTSGTNS
ncbi:hypothetical protein GOP47_0012812, partial [Adiantum capillus-veneris]